MDDFYLSSILAHKRRLEKYPPRPGPTPRRQREAPMDHFQRLPNEMQREVLSYLPIQSILSARSVSSYWKQMISRNFTDFQCHITDNSYPDLSNSTEIFRTVKVFELTGKEKVVSSSRGAGRIIGDAERVHVIGDEVDKTVLNKLLRYAGALTELIFSRCTSLVLTSTLKLSKHCFEMLTKLTIQFKGPPSSEQTAFLTKLANVPEPYLQVLEHLSLTWTCRQEDPPMTFGISRSSKIFANYIATALVISRVRKSLKSLEISRSPRTMVTMQIDLRYYVPTALQQMLITQCTDGFEDLKLEKMKLSLMMNEGRVPWNLENLLLRCQSSLKDLTLSKRCIHQRSFLPQIVQNLLPSNPALLTRIKLSFTIQTGNPISLRSFSHCTQLKTLWISCYCYLFSAEDEWTCTVSELDFLPRTLTDLRLMPSRIICDEDNDNNGFNFQEGMQQFLSFYRESYLILRKEQIEWITRNLLNLRSFACFLLAKETQEARVIDFGMFQIPAREFNDIANMDLELFRELVGMARMNNLEFNMLRAGQLRGFDEGFQRQLFSTVWSTDEIREYLDFCRLEGGVHLETNVIPRKYVEITITK